MTTDGFTDAANDEARRLDDQCDLEWESPHQVFMRGVEWARTHLAAQEPTDAEVEAAAQALADRPGITYGVHPDLMRVVARAALSAARAARRDEET